MLSSPLCWPTPGEPGGRIKGEAALGALSLIVLFGLPTMFLLDVPLLPTPTALLARSPVVLDVAVVCRILGASGDSDGSGVVAEMSALDLRADDLGVMLPVESASLLGVSPRLRLGGTGDVSALTIGVLLAPVGGTDGLALAARRGVIGDRTLFRLGASVGFKGRPFVLLPHLSDMVPL